MVIPRSFFLSALRPCALLGPALGAMGPGAAAQELLYELSSIADPEIELVGDLDGDGFQDLLLGGNDTVEIRSGRDGSLVQVLSAVTPGEDFGRGLSDVGDVDGDGVHDFAVGAPLAGGMEQGRVTLYSGQTRVVLVEFTAANQNRRLGSRIQGMGDVDADGVPDFATTNAKNVQIRSGTDALVIHTLTHAEQSGDFGISLADVGDLDHDGVHDLAVGDVGGGVDFSDYFISGGRVYLFSGATGALLDELARGIGYYYDPIRFAPDAPRFGQSVAAAGDVDGDGTPDVLVGAPWTLVDLYSYYGGPYVHSELGEVFLFSGATGSLVWTLSESATGGQYYNVTRFGSSVESVGDVNLDLVADVLIGNSQYRVGTLGAPSTARAGLYSGLDGQLLYEWTGSVDGPVPLAAGADLDGDGLPDFVFDLDTTTAVAGNDLFLNATPKTLGAGEVLSLQVAQGIPAQPVLVLLTAVDGTPIRLGLGVGAFDAGGVLTLGGALPPAFTGTLDFLAFGFAPAGIAATATETVTVQ